MTFSIVAYSPEEKAWGVAVASKFLAAPAVVSWARAGAGALATQAYGKVSFGPDGLDMMAGGNSAEHTLAKLLSTDELAEDRQVGVVDAKGNVAVHTGVDCFDYSGHVLGDHFTCQGNILTGRNVLDSMAATYRTTSGELADRLVAALLAGDRSGGDRRGRQSAGVIVVKERGGYGGDNDRYVDLRVDDDPDPIARLGQLLNLHHLYFGKSRPEERILIDSSLATELQHIMIHTAHYVGPVNGAWDTSVQEAFWEFVGTENLEERWSIDDEPTKLDPVVLDYLRQRYGDFK